MPQKNETKSARPARTANEWAENLEGELATAAEQTAGAVKQIVRSNPMSSVMTGFGLGLGFGLMVTLLLTRREERWYERNLPHSLQHLPERLRHVPDSIGAYLPSSWTRS